MKTALIIIGVVALLAIVYFYSSSKAKAADKVASNVLPIVSTGSAVDNIAKPTSGVVQSTPPAEIIVVTAPAAHSGVWILACKSKCDHLHPFNAGKRNDCKSACI